MYSSGFKSSAAAFSGIREQRFQKSSGNIHPPATYVRLHTVIRNICGFQVLRLDRYARKVQSKIHPLPKLFPDLLQYVKFTFLPMRS